LEVLRRMQDATQGVTGKFTTSQATEEQEKGNPCQPAGTCSELIGRHQVRRFQAREDGGSLAGDGFQQLPGMESWGRVVWFAQFQSGDQPLRQFRSASLDIEHDVADGQPAAQSPPQEPARQHGTEDGDATEQAKTPRGGQVEDGFEADDDGKQSDCECRAYRCRQRQLDKEASSAQTEQSLQQLLA
jgi:hypothetical protein